MVILCFTGLLLLLTKEVLPLLGVEEGAEPFYKTVKKLHRWLFMVPDNPRGGLSVGRIIVAVTAMCMSVVLLTGVVAWWPKSKKMLKSRLKVSTNKGFRRFVYDTHVSLGIYAFVFLFLMAITGPVFSFGWYRQGMSKLFGQNTEKIENKMPKAGDKPTAAKEMLLLMVRWSRRRNKHSHKRVGQTAQRKKETARNLAERKFSNRCTQASGVVGSQRYFMRLPHLLVVSCLSAATICGGRKGKENTQSVKACAADVRLVDRIIRVKHRF